VAEALIDLGDLGRDEPPPAERSRPWPRSPRPGLRGVLAVAVLVLAAVVIGPGAVPLPPRFADPARIPGSGADEFFIAGDLVVVHSGNDRVLRAYGFDGTLRWATAVPVQRAGPSPVAGDVLLVVGPQWVGQVVALDLANGRPRWTVEGDLNTVADGIPVFGRGAVELENNVRVRDLTAVDPATGRELWHEVIPPLALGDRLMEVYGTGGSRVVGRARVRADGTGDLLDLHTGQWRTISGVPPAPPAPESPAQPGNAAGYQIGIRTGDVTMVFAVGAEPAEGAANISEPGLLVAYGPRAAEPRWARNTATWAPALPCGPWVCLADGAQTQVLDPQTGDEVRRVGWPHVVAGSDRRFLGYTNAGASLEVAVFDAGTGRTVSSHVGWGLVSQLYSDWTPILRRDRGLNWRLAALSLETGIAYPLGTFEAAGERSCQSNRTHVACSVRSGEVLAWSHIPSR
jgi:hypothetical protein